MKKIKLKALLLMSFFLASMLGIAQNQVDNTKPVAKIQSEKDNPPIWQPPNGLLSDTEAKKGVSFTLYPNPAKNSVTVSYTLKNKAETLIIYDLVGNVVDSFPLTGLDGTKEKVIDISTYTKGYYLIKIGEMSKKLVVH